MSVVFGIAITYLLHLNKLMINGSSSCGRGALGTSIFGAGRFAGGCERPAIVIVLPVRSAALVPAPCVGEPEKVEVEEDRDVNLIGLAFLVAQFLTAVVVPLKFPYVEPAFAPATALTAGVADALLKDVSPAALVVPFTLSRLALAPTTALCGAGIADARSHDGESVA